MKARGPTASRGFPDLIQDAHGDGGLFLGQEPPVVLGNHLRRVLDGLTGLLVGPGPLQDMGRQYDPDVVRAVGQQSLDGSAASTSVSFDGCRSFHRKGVVETDGASAF